MLSDIPSPPALTRQNAQRSPLQLSLELPFTENNVWDPFGKVIDFCPDFPSFPESPTFQAPDNCTLRNELHENTILHALEQLNEKDAVEDIKKEEKQTVDEDKHIQALDPAFEDIILPSMDKILVQKAFTKLAEELHSCKVGDCRAYHTILNEWLCARLSRVAAAQMMVRFFAYDSQVCYIFKEINDPGMIRRYTRSCVRALRRKRYCVVIE